MLSATINNHILTLDDEHVYRLDDQVIDGLTSTIKEAGLINGRGDEWYMDRGTAIHMATELWDKGVLDESTLDPRIVGYLESWKRFRADQQYTLTHIELMTYHPALMVGTKIDRLLGPLDIKSGGPEPWHILQIAMQWDTLKAHGMGDYALTPMDVYLDPEGGPPKVKSYTLREMREAFQVYSSMLYFLRWRRERRI